MHLDNFDYTLPSELIAQFPLPKRSSSRLLCLSGATGAMQHLNFCDVLDLLSPNDLLVFNDTRVIKARLFGLKPTGGRIELFVERVIDNRQALVMIRGAKKIKPGAEITLTHVAGMLIEPQIKVAVVEKQDDFFVVKFVTQNVPLTVWDILEGYGQVPLPPYIERSLTAGDEERYQSIFARRNGAVAAPTASLHFDEEVMRQIKEKNIDMAFVTLHVGAGTFQPVRVTAIERHKMHAEYMEVTEEVCAKIRATKERGGRVIAVGTTCVRCLETAAMHTGDSDECTSSFFGETAIFIYPGYKFRCVDVLITNFHLPKSTLLMLVCAFAGYDNVMRAYSEAVERKYRFFSYGDAMFVTRRKLNCSGLWSQS